jgi:undecaprenyl-phosphate 4-deoxy-4-formamido-L-arabinose transferase
LSAFVCEHIVATYEGPYPYVDGLIFQVTQNVGRLQVEHLPRIEGRSNYTLARLFRLWLSMFSNFSVIPLRFATLFGIAFGTLGALAAIIVIVEAISAQRAPQGWASLMVAVLVLAGVQLVVVGLIGEYLGRMFLAVNRKPQYVVREVFWRKAADADDSLEVERPAADTKAGGQPHRQTYQPGS